MAILITFVGADSKGDVESGYLRAYVNTNRHLYIGISHDGRFDPGETIGEGSIALDKETVTDLIKHLESSLKEMK